MNSNACNIVLTTGIYTSDVCASFKNPCFQTEFVLHDQWSCLFSQEQLIRKLAVILDVQDEDIIVEYLKEAGVGHR